MSIKSESNWSIAKARATYNITGWSEGFFDIDEQGNVVVVLECADNDTTSKISLPELINELLAQGVALPILLRFTDILGQRVQQLTRSFANAIAQFAYQGSYTAVYPIKVNQERSVVQAIVAPANNNDVSHIGLEAGSKPELLAIMALATENTVIICNGYKDREYIRLALIGQQLGHRVYLIIEKFSELSQILQEASDMQIEPCLGVRVRLASIGKGNWQNTGGDKSKFGLSAAQILKLIASLQQSNQLCCLQLLHFHIGSQIANIRDIQRGMRECARFYVQLRELGVPIDTIDVGGGLAVDYDGTGSRNFCSMNYSMQSYANNVVQALLEVCMQHDLPQPNIITESGRAMVAHHAVLVTNVIDVEHPSENDEPLLVDNDSLTILQDLMMRYETINKYCAIEAYHDACYYLAEVQSRYVHGALSLPQRAQAEQLYFAICQKVRGLLNPGNRAHREIIDLLQERMVCKYFCNFSLFQSLPDVWGIEQIFPIMPIAELDHEPSVPGVLRDITCDSDGRIDWYVGANGLENALPLPEFSYGKPLLLGIFMVGAYQEMLGDIHNLFGETNAVQVRCDDKGEVMFETLIMGETVADVLRNVHYDATELLQHYSEKIKDVNLSEQNKKNYLTELQRGLVGYTYLEK